MQEQPGPEGSAAAIPARSLSLSYASLVTWHTSTVAPQRRSTSIHCGQEEESSTVQNLGANGGRRPRDHCFYHSPRRTACCFSDSLSPGPLTSTSVAREPAESDAGWMSSRSGAPCHMPT